MKYINGLISVYRRWRLLVPSLVKYGVLLPLKDSRTSFAFLDNAISWLNLWTPARTLTSVDLHEVFPNVPPKEMDTIEIALIGRFHDTGNFVSTQSLREFAALALTTKIMEPKRVFEFGTNTGRTTRLFAENSPADTRIVTLDLPQKDTVHGLTIGREFADCACREKITQVFDDSMKFDPKPYEQSMDLVFIDACHQYDYVKRDTENALAMAKDGGLLMWHDFKHAWYWSSVTRYLREFARNTGQEVFHIRGTTLACCKYRKAGP